MTRRFSGTGIRRSPREFYALRVVPSIASAPVIAPSGGSVGGWGIGNSITLTATAGRGSPTPVDTFTFYRDGVAVGGRTALSLAAMQAALTNAVVAGDLGPSDTVVQTSTNGVGTPATSTSNAIQALHTTDTLATHRWDNIGTTVSGAWSQRDDLIGTAHATQGTAANRPLRTSHAGRDMQDASGVTVTPVYMDTASIATQTKPWAVMAVHDFADTNNATQQFIFCELSSNTYAGVTTPAAGNDGLLLAVAGLGPLATFPGGQSFGLRATWLSPNTTGANSFFGSTTWTDAAKVAWGTAPGAGSITHGLRLGAFQVASLGNSMRGYLGAVITHNSSIDEAHRLFHKALLQYQIPTLP